MNPDKTLLFKKVSLSEKHNFYEYCCIKRGVFHNVVVNLKITLEKREYLEKINSYQRKKEISRQRSF